ncbi:RNA-directed DNA polymerase [Abeliophyllum distichum]|uniref:RNA-directed DNA polymerase n=1 Tax=Abeliophyllum distichum TaxID=126358 RepID=A0ABD1PRV8_9LAMI
MLGNRIRRDHNPMAKFEDEDDYNYIAEMGRMRRRGDMYERAPRGGDYKGHDGVDRNIENIKMKILSFQGDTEPPKKKEDVTSNNKLKSDFQPSKNWDIKCFKRLGSGNNASQCPNKRVLILRDNGEVETEDVSDSDEMLELEDNGVKYPVDGEVLFARHALHAQIKVDDLDIQEV